MRASVAPVVLSDNWQRPVGPDWESCSIWVPEAQIRDLPRILDERGDAWCSMGRAAHEAFRMYFDRATVFGHCMSAVEGLLGRDVRGSRLGDMMHQAGELVSLAIGVPGPRLLASRTRGATATRAERSRS
jgi:hypothetical protein